MTASPLATRTAKYTALDAPTGFEEPVLRAVRDDLQQCSQRVEVDVRGNVFGYQDGSSADGPLIMITAHADEIGFLATSILAGGYLRFTKLGGPTSMVLPGQRVRVLSRSGPLEGVIGVKPGHILSPAGAHQVPPIAEMYIDVGAESAEQAAEWGIEAGTPAVFVGEWTATQNPNRFFGKCVDNRAGIVAVLEIAERLAKVEAAASFVHAIVVEEEVGLRGAAVAALDVKPDVVIAIDTVPSGGTPDLKPDELPWSIGGGPLLKVRETRGLSTHGPLRELFRQTAEEKGIPLQLIVDTAGMTDAASAQQASGNIAALTIGLARKYSHSAVEMFDVRDLDQIVELVFHAVGKITTKQQLLRI